MQRGGRKGGREGGNRGGGPFFFFFSFLFFLHHQRPSKSPLKKTRDVQLEWFQTCSRKRKKREEEGRGGKRRRRRRRRRKKRKRETKRPASPRIGSILPPPSTPSWTDTDTFSHFTQQIRRGNGSKEPASGYSPPCPNSFSLFFRLFRRESTFRDSFQSGAIHRRSYPDASNPI